MSAAVLLVSQPTTEGVAVCVRELAQAGVAAGWRVTVACPQGGQLSGWAKRCGASWVELPMRRAPGPGDVRAVAILRRLIPRYDVLHLHSSKAGALGRLAQIGPRRRRVPCVFTPHAWSWLVGGRLATAYRTIEWLTAPAADVIVAESDEERRVGVAALGRRTGDIRIITNGVDLARFPEPGRRSTPAGPPLVVCVGRITRQKGQDVAVQALAQMSTSGVRLRLVGDGPDRAAVQSQSRRLGVADRVEFAGTVPDIGPHLRAADVVVFPSRWEGLPLSLLDAMATGATIVATEAAAAGTLDGAGVLVAGNDPAALARAVDAVLADPAESARLGAAARQRAEERFSLRASTDAVLGVWRELASR